MTAMKSLDLSSVHQQNFLVFLLSVMQDFKFTLSGLVVAVAFSFLLTYVEVVKVLAFISHKNVADE